MLMVAVSVSVCTRAKLLYLNRERANVCTSCSLSQAHIAVVCVIQSGDIYNKYVLCFAYVRQPIVHNITVYYKYSDFKVTCKY